VLAEPDRNDVGGRVVDDGDGRDDDVVDDDDDDDVAVIGGGDDELEDEFAAVGADVVDLLSDGDSDTLFKSPTTAPPPTNAMTGVGDEASSPLIVKDELAYEDDDDDDDDDDDGDRADAKKARVSISSSAVQKRRLSLRHDGGADSDFDDDDVCVVDDGDDEVELITTVTKPGAAAASAVAAAAAAAAAASVPPRFRINHANEHEDLMPTDAVDYVIDADVKPPISIPASISCRLREYQRVGVEFLYKRFRDNTGAILGDDMGMGKTIQTIAFLSAVLRVGDERRRINYTLIPDRSRPVALIVLPASVILQWEAEIKKWSTMRVSSFQGSDRKRAMQSIEQRRSDVLLVSYEMLRTNREEIDRIKWTCVVFDEIHRLKNGRSKLTVECGQIACTRRFGLTGTVMQNNFEELHCLINFVAPGHLGPYRMFKQWFVDPIVSGQDYSAQKQDIGKGRFASRRLNAKLQQVMLRRKKELIAAELPGKEDSVVFCQLTPIQRRMYERALAVPEVATLRRLVVKCQCGSGRLLGSCCGAAQSTALSGGSADVNWKKEVLRTINRLNNLSNHPCLLAPQLRDAADKRDRDAQFEARVFGDDAAAVRQAMATMDHTEISGKMRVLASLLRAWGDERPRSKVLLFSRSTRTLDMLGGFLHKLRIAHLRLDGSTTNKKRDQLVAQFQHPDAREWVFLVSTRAGGLGLNLTAANIVVVFDPNWNQTWDLQAQDRAYRIGQKRYTRVFRFVSSGTLEELLYVRQIYKQQFANIAQEASHERRFFDRDELFGLGHLLADVSDISRTSELIRRTMHSVPGAIAGAATSAASTASTATSAPTGADDFFRIELEQVTDGGLLANPTSSEGGAAAASTAAVAGATGVVAADPQVSAVLDEIVDENAQRELEQYERNIAVMQNDKSVLRDAGVPYIHTHDALLGNAADELELAQEAPVTQYWVDRFDKGTTEQASDGPLSGLALGSASGFALGAFSSGGGGAGAALAKPRNSTASAKARIKRKRSAKLLSITQQQAQESMRSLFGTSSTFMVAHQRTLAQQQQQQQLQHASLQQVIQRQQASDGDGGDGIVLSSGSSDHSPEKTLERNLGAYQQHFSSGFGSRPVSSAGAFTGMFPSPSMTRSYSAGSLLSLGSAPFVSANYSPPVVTLHDSPDLSQRIVPPPPQSQQQQQQRATAMVVLSDEE
jgi:superfamily II DNA or RNA helicase